MKGRSMRRPGKGEIAARWMIAALQSGRLDDPAFHEAFDAAAAKLELLESGPVRSRMAADLIQLLLGRQEQGGPARLRCLDRLVEIGDENSSARPGWRRIRAAARIMALMRAGVERELVDYRAAMDEVDLMAAGFAEDPAIQALASAAQALLGMSSGVGAADPVALRVFVADLGKLAGDNVEIAPMLELLPDYIDVLDVHESGETETAFARFSELVERSQQMPASPFGDALVEMMPILEPMLSLADGMSDADVARLLDTSGKRADRPGIAAEERAFFLVIRAVAALRLGTEQDLARIDLGIADLRTAVTLTSRDHPEHVFRLGWLALALYRRSEITGALGEVDEAIAVIEDASELCGGPSHPHWSIVSDSLTQYRRRRGGNDSLWRRTALEGLRGYAWRVLLQPDPTSARAVARAAAAEATEVATRCLVDHEPLDALRALDTGRGLMLFAATELRDPCTRLIDAGQSELAERWRTEEDPPARLRQDVVEVLFRDAGLLDPPDLGEIQDALRALDADALVYLILGATSPAVGWAVIAPVEGAARYLPLPNLAIEVGSDIERYLVTMAARDVRVGRARDLKGDAQDEFVDSIDPLCEWAWKAAMGPVVKPYLDTERVSHLVLIPMGDLARVPWQAARGPDGRRLVEHVALSQAVSARMLCDTAAASPVRLTSAGLVVADPDTCGRAADLPSARLEAYAIRETFYPSATYVGRLPKGTVSASGSGTPDDVRGWLRADGAEAGAMLHLASHGVMDTALGTASSRLVLAGGDLAADELIGHLAHNERHPIGLAVLAACHTGRSIHGYDEAYSLATTFLAAGARSVLSAQWSIPDQDTSLLMYMFHHYLVTERRPAWEALRRAQVWMLNSARAAPARMPEPLRRMTKGPDPARVVAWAGFVHWGQ